MTATAAAAAAASEPDPLYTPGSRWVLQDTRHVGRDGDGETPAQWPRRTQEPCRYDMHRFDGVPYGIPVAWDERRRQCTLRGYFCSLECAMASLRYDSTDSDTRSQMQHLRTLARNVYGVAHLSAAPPREYLLSHTIEEFRRVCRTQTQDHHKYTLASRLFVRDIELICEMRRHRPPKFIPSSERLRMAREAARKTAEREEGGGSGDADDAPSKAAATSSTAATKRPVKRKRKNAPENPRQRSNTSIMSLLQGGGGGGRAAKRSKRNAL